MKEELEIVFNENNIKGILIKEDDEYITLKLKSGYNANLKKENIKLLSRNQIEEKDKPKVEKPDTSDLPKITILHTGGTIASKVDYRTGGVSSKFTADELMVLFYELNEKAAISARMIGNIFSEDMRFNEYNLMLDEIQKAINEKTQGIIIAHGTDTMHYSSAALQYACKNLSIPVILVGAQRSSDRASSDAFTNLNAAVDFIIENSKHEKAFRRVGICMHENLSDNSFLILDGLNAKKMHSTRRDAFKQINYPAFARIENSKLEILRKDLLSEKPEKKFNYAKYNTELKIGFFKSHPNMFAEELKNLEYYDAVVIEGTGIGNLPEHDDNTKKDGKILKALEELTNKIKVLAGVQTTSGEISLDIYSRGRDLQTAGIIGNRINLTTETIFCRTAFCLSQKEKPFEEIWDENLEGFKIRSEDIDN